jgi:transposase-like protein
LVGWLVSNALEALAFELGELGEALVAVAFVGRVIECLPVGPGALVAQLDKAGYTAAARCLTDDLDALVVHLRYPTRHRRRWRSTNLLERSLGEVKRRTKVIGRFPGETSCLTLVWAVLDLYISHATNGTADTFALAFGQLGQQVAHAVNCTVLAV